jgi:hypothetical protein
VLLTFLLSLFVPIALYQTAKPKLPPTKSSGFPSACITLQRSIKFNSDSIYVLSKPGKRRRVGIARH